MLAKHTKLTMAACLLLGLFLGFLGGIGVKELEEKPTSDCGQIPLRKILITTDDSQQEELFNQLQEFSNENAFAVRIASTSSSGEDFLIQMWREDINVTGGNSPAPTSGELHIGFYNNNCIYPVSESALDDLANNLKDSISEIPNATFSVEK